MGGFLKEIQLFGKFSLMAGLKSKKEPSWKLLQMLNGVQFSVTGDGCWQRLTVSKNTLGLTKFSTAKKNEADKVKDVDFIRVGGGSFQALSDKTKIFIETHAETFLRPRPRLFLDQ